MLQAIRAALFAPDRSRSGMVTPSMMPVVPGTPFKVPVTLPAPATPGFDIRSAFVPLNVDCVVAKQKQGVVSFSPEHESADLTSWQHCGSEKAAADDVVSSPDSETTEEDSVQSISDSEAEIVEDRRPEFIQPDLKYYLNQKSLVIHCERTEGVLKCGRRVSPHFIVLYELNGIRCSRCFDI